MYEVGLNSARCWVLQVYLELIQYHICNKIDAILLIHAKNPCRCVQWLLAAASSTKGKQRKPVKLFAFNNIRLRHVVCVRTTCGDEDSLAQLWP